MSHLPDSTHLLYGHFLQLCINQFFWPWDCMQRDDQQLKQKALFCFDL